MAVLRYENVITMDANDDEIVGDFFIAGISFTCGTGKHQVQLNTIAPTFNFEFFNQRGRVDETTNAVFETPLKVNGIKLVEKTTVPKVYIYLADPQTEAMKGRRF